LRNVSLQKLHQPKAQQRQTKHVHTEENVTVVGELVVSQLRPATDSSFNALNSIIWCRTGRLFSPRSLFEVFKRLKENCMIEANRRASLFCSKPLLNDVLFIRFSEKHHSH